MDVKLSTAEMLDDVVLSDKHVDIKLLRKAAEELREYEQVFATQYEVRMKAIRLWQTEHPDDSLSWPDATDMTVWLMDQLEDKRRELRRQ